METWPGGSHMLLQTEIDDVRLYALGYKYCAKKVMCFIFNEGASHTEAGLPYIAKVDRQKWQSMRTKNSSTTGMQYFFCE